MNGQKSLDSDSFKKGYEHIHIPPNPTQNMISSYNEGIKLKHLEASFENSRDEIQNFLT